MQGPSEIRRPCLGLDASVQRYWHRGRPFQTQLLNSLDDEPRLAIWRGRIAAATA